MKMPKPELVLQDGYTHALHPLLPDDTLCGMALEGSEMPAWDKGQWPTSEFAAAEPSPSRVIDCGQCLIIIKAVKAIPRRCVL